MKNFPHNGSCPQVTHACVPKRHFGVQARTMKILNLISSPLLAALSACAARWGRIKVAAGSESLWLGEG